MRPTASLALIAACLSIHGTISLHGSNPYDNDNSDPNYTYNRYKPDPRSYSKREHSQDDKTSHDKSSRNDYSNNDEYNNHRKRSKIFSEARKRANESDYRGEKSQSSYNDEQNYSEKRFKYSPRDSIGKSTYNHLTNHNRKSKTSNKGKYPRKEHKPYDRTSSHYTSSYQWSGYPKEWERYSVRDHFKLLNNVKEQQKSKSKEQHIIDWCNRMRVILDDPKLKNQVNQITLARCLSVLGKLAKNKDNKRLLKEYFKKYPKFLRTWHKAALKLLKSTNPSDGFSQQQLSNIFYAHAKMGIELPEKDGFRNAWYKAALVRLQSTNPSDGFNQQELANIFYGHAQLGIELPEKNGFRAAWHKVSLEKLTSTNPSDKFNQQELANIFYGNAQLGIMLPEEDGFRAAWYKAAFNLLTSTNPRDGFNQQQLSNIFYGHAKLGINLSEEDGFRDAWYKAASKALTSTNPSDRFNQQQLANMFYGNAQLGIMLPNKDGFRAAWYKAAFNLLTSTNPSDGFSEQSLASIFYGHTQLGINLPEKGRFRAAWYKAAFKVLTSTNPRDRFNQQALANIFYGHAQLGIKLPEKDRFRAAWYKAASKALTSTNPSDGFNQQALANIFYGHAQLGIELPEKDGFRNAWYKAALERLKYTNHSDAFNPQALANIFYAHALLNIKPNKELVDKIETLDDMQELRIEEIHMLYLSYKYYDLEDKFIARISTDRLLESMKNSRKRTSKLQQSVENVIRVFLKDKEYLVDSEIFIDEIASHCDILITKSSEKFILEVDGPSHYFADGKTLNPQSKLLTRILENAGYKVVRVPYFEWNKLESDDEKTTYLKSKLPDLF